MIIDELVAILGYDIKGQDNLKKFNDGLVSATKRAGELATGFAKATSIVAGALTAAGAGIYYLSKSAAGPLDDLIKSADRIGIGFEALQEIGFAAEQSGTSISELQSSLQSMGRQLAEAARGTGRAKLALEDYKISATDTAGNVRSIDDVLADVSNRMKDLSDQQALDLGTKLGLSPGMITMLKSGNEEIDKLRKQARDAGLIFSVEDARNAEAFNDEMNLFSRSVSAIKNRIGLEFIPTLREAIGSIQSWMNENGILIRDQVRYWSSIAINAVSALIESMGRIYRAAGRLATVIGEVFGGKTERGIKIIGAAIAALLAYFRPMVAAATALYLAIDDLFTYLEGGDSLIGRFIDKLRELLGVSKGVAEGITATFAALGIGLISAIPLIVTNLASSLIKGLIGALSGPLGWALIFVGLADFVTKALFDISLIDVGIKWGKELFNGIWETLKNVGDWALGKGKNSSLRMTPDQIDAFSQLDRLQGYLPNNVSNSSSSNVTVNVGGVTVNNADQAGHATAAAIGASVGRSAASAAPARIQGGNSF